MKIKRIKGIKEKEVVEHVEKVYNASQDLIEKWFDCLPEELDDVSFPSTLLGALHFAALIAQSDENMRKETFLTLNEEAWEFMINKTEKARELLMTATEKVH